jgi:Uma2 family endonuclease
MGAKAGSSREPATYEDILALPEHLVGEIIDGELIVSPRPTPRHVLAASSLGDELVGPFQKGRGGPGGWWILDEPELHLEAQVLVPDLAGWRRERLPRLPDTAFFETSPDWVCEVLSPGTALVDRTRKLHLYRANRVGTFWMIDPSARTLEVYRLQGDDWLVVLTAGGEAKVRAQPFEAVEIDLAGLWEPDLG